MGRAGLAVAGQVAGVAQAYGIPLAQAAAAQVTLSQLGGRPANLGTILAGLPANLPMSHERFLEQATTVAGAGGLGGIPLSDLQVRRYTEATMGLGGRAEQFPGQTYAERYAGMARAVEDPTGAAVAWRAIAIQMKKNPIITIPSTGEQIDVRTWSGQQIALQETGALPQMEQSRKEAVDEFAGGNEELGIALHQRAFGVAKTYQARRDYYGMRRMEAEGGPLPERINAPVTGVEADVARRRAGRYRPAMDIIEREAEMVGKWSDTGAIKAMEDIRTFMEKGIGELATVVDASGDAFKAVTDELVKLVGPLKEVASAIGDILAAVGRPIGSAISAVADPIGGGLSVAFPPPAPGAPRPTFGPGGHAPSSGWMTHPRKTVP
jgi:hypothetical protein